MSSRKRKQIDPIEQAIETVMAPGSFISFNAVWSFVDDVQDVANDIAKIINEAPERAARLYETFIAACHEKVDEINDSSGNFGMLVENLVRDWIKARQAASDDPDETAKSLLSWMEDDPYGFCHDLRSFGENDLFEMKRAQLAKLGRPGGALQSAWSEFEAHPSTFTYQELMRYVPAKEKMAWHQKAMEGSEKGDLSA